jgi:hypothetical protein
VSLAWEWQVQRVVRGSFQLDVVDAVRLIHAAAVHSSREADAGAAHHTGGADTPPLSMAAATLHWARKALVRLLGHHPLLAWMCANPGEAEAAALAAIEPESRTSLPGGGWVGQSSEFFGCRVVSLDAFWTPFVKKLVG